MRTFQIIFPLTGNSTPVRHTVERMLTDWFGGYTVTPGQGGWLNDRTGKRETEGVAVYTAVNIKRRPGAEADVQRLCRWIAAALDQQAVLWNYTDETYWNMAEPDTGLIFPAADAPAAFEPEDAA